MPDVTWNGLRRNMLLDSEDRVLHPRDIQGATPLLKNGRNCAVRVDSGIIVGTYAPGWVSFPADAEGPACCVGVRDDKHDPAKPIVIMLDGTRLRMLPGSATNLVRDALGSGRFEGEMSREVEFYHPQTLAKERLTLYIMGSSVEGLSQVRFMAFARAIPRVPWQQSSAEAWRRWLGVPIVQNTFVREDFGIILQIFDRDPLVDASLGDTEMVQLPWPMAPFRRDQLGLTYLWSRGRVLECSIDMGMARMERQTGRTSPVARDTFQHARDLSSLFNVKSEEETAGDVAAEGETDGADKPKRSKKK